MSRTKELAGSLAYWSLVAGAVFSFAATMLNIEGMTPEENMWFDIKAMTLSALCATAAGALYMSKRS